MVVNIFKPLPREFYTRRDVCKIARELLGKVLYTKFDKEITAGVIIETEAYAGISDKASHAFNNRRTLRTEIMYGEGGYAYVYLCYGIHYLFNVVTSVKSDPQAVLIRGIEPLYGRNVMKNRAGKEVLTKRTYIGPGNVTKLLGITVKNSGSNLCNDTKASQNIWIQDEGIELSNEQIITGSRIGVGYAGEDAFLPYRFQWNKKSS